MAATTQILPPAQSRETNEAPADLALLLSRAFELGDSLKNCTFAAEYVYWKDKVSRDAEAQLLAGQFAKAKINFEECERFGRFHPDYNAALDRVYEIEGRLDSLECVRKFKEAERSMDRLLNEVSRTIAYAVSLNIKVPDNDPNPKSGGCGSGGSCSCGSGGCG